MTKIEINSPVTGTVWKIDVTVGSAVKQGDVIMILESMKMEIPVEASISGVIKALYVQANDTVEDEQALCVVES